MERQKEFALEEDDGDFCPRGLLILSIEETGSRAETSRSDYRVQTQ